MWANIAYAIYMSLYYGLITIFNFAVAYLVITYGIDVVEFIVF